MFYVCMAVGVYLVRYRRQRTGVPRSQFRAWHAMVVLYLAAQVYLLVMPWFPPEGGAYAGDVSFWYATYCVVGISM